MEALLSLPELGALVMAGIGPVAFHRLSAGSAGLRACPAPVDHWRLHWMSPKEPTTAEAAAMCLLRSATGACMKLPHAKVMDSTAERREAFLEELYMLTAPGRPAKRVHTSAHLLDVAVQRGLRPAIPLLRARGYTLEMLDAYSLESLIQKDDHEAVAAYLDAGISPDVRVSTGQPVLTVAVALSAAKVSKLLLERQASVNERSGFGQWTALMWAAHAGWEEGCEMLLKAGAVMDHRDEQDRGALDLVQQRKRSVEALLGAFGES